MKWCETWASRQPTCGPTQYLKDSSLTQKGTCMARQVCEKNMFLSQTARVTNPGVCAACRNVKCDSGSDSNGLQSVVQRSGTCGGTTDGFMCTSVLLSCSPGSYFTWQASAFKASCTPQPTCVSGEFLSGGSTTTKGACKACTTCGNITIVSHLSVYSTGTCAGNEDKTECKDQPKCTPTSARHIRHLKLPCSACWVVSLPKCDLPRAHSARAPCQVPHKCVNDVGALNSETLKHYHLCVPMRDQAHIMNISKGSFPASQQSVSRSGGKT